MRLCLPQGCSTKSWLVSVWRLMLMQPHVKLGDLGSIKPFLSSLSCLVLTKRTKTWPDEQTRNISTFYADLSSNPSARENPLGYPERGDIYRVEIEEYEAKGHEFRGCHYYVVVSNNALKNLGLVIVVPLTSPENKETGQPK